MVLYLLFVFERELLAVLHQHLGDLANVEPMVILGGVMLQHLGINKGVLLQIVGVELAADQNQIGLGGVGNTLGGFTHRQSRGGELVPVSPRPGAAVAQSLAVLPLGEEGEGQGVGVLHDAVGVPLGTDEADRHGLVPKDPRAAPGGGHGVDLAFGVCGGDEHPVLPDAGEEVIGQSGGRDRAVGRHGSTSLGVKNNIPYYYSTLWAEMQRGRAKKTRKIPEKFLKLFFKNLLTNRTRCAIICTVAEITAPHRGDVKKNLKNFEKTFQKPLDRSKAMWYNKQVVRNTATSGA